MRTTAIRALLGAGLSGVLALTDAVTTTSSATADTAATSTATEDPGKLLLMLDASGSMKEPDPAGGTKMTAAKKALTGVVDSLPEDTHVGLRVYGATEPGGTPTKAACADTQLAVPIGPVDKPALTKAIKAFDAKGETPIAHSLTKAMDDLGTKGKRNIVLVSDGKESCVPDPCPVVKDLVEDGVDLRIDTVGFGVKDTARKQLTCIADAGNGTYYDATDADELTTSLNKISTRAVRDFAFTGQPVTGIDLAENEQAPADLPTLTPGLWSDELTASKDTWRAYSIERTQKDSTLHVSVLIKPTAYGDRWADNLLDELSISILAPDGTACARETSFAGDHQGFRPLVTVTARLLGQPLEEAAQGEACRAKSAYTVLVHREGAQETVPTEIQVIEEPRVTNLPDLLGIVDHVPEKKELAAGEAQPVTGGLSFADAPEITEGTWADTLVPGETLVYRVKVDYGQTARFTANGPTGGFRFPAGTSIVNQLYVDGVAFSPDRQDVDRGMGTPGSFSPGSALAKTVTTTDIRYKNRYAENFVDPWSARASSMSGWYYYAVSVSTKDIGEALAGQPIKVAFTVDIEGKPSNAVEYAGEEGANADATDTKQAGDSDDTGNTEASAAAAGTSDEGGSPLPRIGGGLLAAIILGAGAWFGLRRKGAQEPGRSQE